MPHQTIIPSQDGSSSGQMTPSALNWSRAESISSTSSVRGVPLIMKFELEVVTVVMRRTRQYGD